MASKTTGKAAATKKKEQPQEESRESTAVKGSLESIVKKLVVKGKEQGFLT